MADRLEIVNAALGLAGASDIINDYDDPSSENARAARLHYPSLVSSLLRISDWNFNSRIVELTPVTYTSPFANVEVETAWLPPAGAIRVMDVYDSSRQRKEYRLGEHGETNQQILLVAMNAATEKMFARILFEATPSVWPPDFQEAVKYLLADRLMRHLRSSEGTEAAEMLRQRGEELLAVAHSVNAAEGSNLFNSGDPAVQVQERALSLAGGHSAEGRTTTSTSGEQRLINQFWEDDRRNFLQLGEFPFNRRFIDLDPLVPQPIDDPSAAGYEAFYYEYPDNPKLLRLLKTWVRWTEFEMIERPFTLIDKGTVPDGSNRRIRWVLMNTGWYQGSRTDVRVSSLFLVDEPDLSKWTDAARLGMSYKLAMSIASTMGKPQSFIEMLERNMREQVAEARATGIQELGQRPAETYPRNSKFREARR